MACSERDADVSNFVTTWTVDNPPYVILKWTIENLCNAETLLKSPSFDISQTSKWNLLLDPNIVVEEDQFIGVYLKKNDSSNTGRFTLKGELSVHGPNNELLYDKLFDEIYDGKKSIAFRLAKVVFPLQSGVEDSYLVRCEMVIAREIDTVDISRSHLQKLSYDYKKLYHDNKFTDISISAIDDIIYSHKAFLHARSSHFANKLAENVTYLTENNEKNPHLAVVLLFLYTGNPDLLLSSVPLEMFGGIYKLAKKWHLNELVNLLTPLKMHCRTHIRNECFQYTWEIKNFTKLSAESSGVLHSSEFYTKEKSSAKWRLTLEKHLRDSGVEFYGLYLEKVNSDSSSYKTNAEFRIHNNRGDTVLKKREYRFGPRANQKCGFSSLLDKSFVRGDSAQADTLKIICVLKIRLDSDSWIDFKSTSVDVSDKDTCFFKYLKILSSNFKELYESQKYADLKLFAGEEMIMVHKAVLWARSPYFSRILSQYSAEYVAVDVQHDILKDILLYIYTAEIPILTPLNMQKMYQASFLLQLQELWSVCKSCLLQKITVDNVLELMVLAHKYDDKELKNSTEKFACTPGNAKMFLNTQRWKIFREKHSTLAIIIYHNLSWSFCNHF